MDKNICNICKIRAYIECDLCDPGLFFCSRGHLNSHKIKAHNALRNIPSNSNLTSKNRNEETSNNSQNSTNKGDSQIDLRKLFEYIQTLKIEIESKINNKNYIDAILTINRCLSLSNKFYQEDHLFVIYSKYLYISKNLDLLFRLAECNIRTSNLEEGINKLEKIINITENTKQTSSITIFRYKTFMLIGAVSINIGDFSKALKTYTILEIEITEYLAAPELNLKLAAIYLNLGICYIHMNNPNLAEKNLKKGLIHTEGMLGNEIIHQVIIIFKFQLQADINENIGIYNEIINNPKEALNYYKKSLKTKFHLFGENHDEVLELQYKIASIYISIRQFKEAEEILIAITDVVSKEKLGENITNNYSKTAIDHYYRYGVYFYTAGVVLVKNNRNFLAKEYLNKANVMWKDLVDPNDPGLTSIKTIIKISDRKI